MFDIFHLIHQKSKDLSDTKYLKNFIYMLQYILNLVRFIFKITAVSHIQKFGDVGTFFI
jgi:hypothetical protein